MGDLSMESITLSFTDNGFRSLVLSPGTVFAFGSQLKKETVIKTMVTTAAIFFKNIIIILKHNR